MASISGSALSAEQFAALEAEGGTFMPRSMESLFPKIDELAAESVIFDRAYAHSPQTLPFTDTDRSGRYMRYGIREHGMAAAMNGIFLHGGFAPNGATFLIFTDYARPAMRLAAQIGRAHV